MNRQIVITDVTHFKNEDKVCVAGVDINTGECLRPTSPGYLSKSHVQALNIKPSTVLSGEFQFLNSNKPHCEDVFYKNLKFERLYSDDEFRKILENSLSENIENGFQVQSNGQKCIHPSLNPQQSIITVLAENIEIIKSYEKVKVHFFDTLNQYEYIPVTDSRYWGNENYQKIDFNNKKVFLRIGIGRQYKSPDGRDGYWLQVNGIYTFPK